MSSIKITLNLPEELVNRLKKESEELNITVTEVIRRGLETELFLTDEEKAGSKILLEKSNNKLVQIVRR